MLFQGLFEAVRFSGSPTVKTLEALGEAQRIVLSETVGQAASQIAESSHSIEQARPHLFAPFETTWIEQVEPGGGRSGWLIKADSDSHHQSGTASLFGMRHGRIRSLCVFSLDIANLDQPALVPDQNYVQAKARIHGIDGQAEMDLDIVEGACRRLLAIFALLSTRGATEQSSPNLGKLNKARASKRKKLLLEYSEVSLNIDMTRVVGKYGKNHDGGDGGSHRAQHQVRAHLRLLPSGSVTIVRAHTRGDPQIGVRQHSYTVR